jgi:nitroimidazol reductase NimA-like FMN-containing flavoprotein (pyridoxamine 5'-phosphate oxidase superfamily)
VVNPITQLSREEAWKLLEASQIGRIASARDGAPDIFPVNYVVFDDAIYFRTAAGSRLRVDCDNRAVAFESAWQLSDNAWSVVILGHLRTLTTTSDQEILDKLPILDFAPDRPYVWMQVIADDVRGRRFSLNASEGR